MLILSRRTHEIIEIRPRPGTECVKLGDVFANGSGIQISLVSVSKGRVRVAIEAPAELKIWRGASPADKSGKPGGPEEE